MKKTLANLKGVVELVGKPESVNKVYKDLSITGRNKVNKRSGKRYTEFGEPVVGEGRTEKGSRTGKLTFDFSREMVYGNLESSVENHITRSIARLQVDVSFKIKDVVREEL